MWCLCVRFSIRVEEVVVEQEVCGGKLGRRQDEGHSVAGVREGKRVSTPSLALCGVQGIE